jgi:hypothetical protein
MYQCSTSGTITNMQSCKSARHCQAGKEKGFCALCLAGAEDEYVCDGALLTRCSDAGDGYVPIKTCSTEALCNVGAGDCTSAACTTGQIVCSGDELRRCNADQTAFEPVKTCEAGLCDAAAGACDVCVPRSAGCEGRSVSLTCNAEGTHLQREECPSERPICAGEGNCVQCANAADCSANERCESSRCVCPGSRDLNSDLNNCGACGNRCGANEGCVRGQCESYCAGADILNDPMNCGMSCERCATDEVCRNGSCVGCGDINTDEANCGACGNRCTSGTECVQGRCEEVPRCGDGNVDTGSGEQCDPGRDVAGCNRCRITGLYGDSCSTPGPITVSGSSALCFSFGTSGQPAAPMVLPLCYADGTCPSVPGASWPTECAAGTGGPNGTCFLSCSSAADCPPAYECTNSTFCWKR